jgi:DNA repair photolyase
MERALQLTRGCIQILKEGRLRLQIVTKSDIVIRDADLLCKMPSVVCITLTTLCDEVSRLLEPKAPSPRERLNAMRVLRDSGVPICARLDPIIPGINDQEICDMVAAVCKQGAQHITSSTFKAKPDSWRRMKEAFPVEARALGESLEKGVRLGGYRYLPAGQRANLMQRMKKIALENGITFSTCREGFCNDGGVCCDGSHLAQVDGLR